MFKKIFLIIIGYIFFEIGLYYKPLVFKLLIFKLDDNPLSYSLYYLLVGIPIFLVIYFNSGRKNIFKELGLSKSILEGFMFSCVAILPMFLGGFFLFKFNNEIGFLHLLKLTLLAGFFEELYFRGFLFGEFYKRTKLGFLPAVLICSFVFACGHIYQAHNLAEFAGVFLATFIGSVLFAWLYVEWDCNLWIPIFMHTFMNLIWVVFSEAENAGGGLYANIFRFSTIILAIFITVYRKKRRGEKMFINKNNIFLKRVSLS